MVLCDIVTAVYQIVGHDIQEVQMGFDVYDIATECNHVALDAGNCSCDQLGGAQGRAKFTEQEWVSLDFPLFLRVWDLLIVLAVTPWVFPIYVDACKETR